MTYFPGLRNVPAKRKHTFSEFRPWQLHLGWALIQLCWLGMLGTAVFGLFTAPKTTGSTIFWVIFWALLVTAIIVRGWWGGPSAWVYMKLLAQLLGALFLVGLVIFFVLGLTTLGLQPTMLIYFLPTALAGISLLSAGFLLNSTPVRSWYAG